MITRSFHCCTWWFHDHVGPFHCSQKVL